MVAGVAMVIVVVGVALGAIFWWQVWPALSYRTCENVARERTNVAVMYSNDNRSDVIALYESFYNGCLRNRGIDK